jgi:FemAB-related protein (PEP-CTERM system-associated)
LAESGGAIRGVLPLGHIKSLVFGSSLISTPFCVYGGILASDERAFRALETEACRLAERLKVDYLELRNKQRAHPDWPCKDLHVYFAKELAPDVEKNLLAIPRKQRAMVRKGIKAGLTGVVDRDVERFFDLFSESVRNLGTPVFPRRYFEVLRDVFGDDCEVLTIEHEGQPVASVMSFYFRDEVLPYYGGGTFAARDVAGNDFMYWDLMRRATERGLKWFDYGRSKREVGSYQFKKHWGFEPQPLFYEFYLVRAKQLPDVNPLNPKYQRFIELWKKLPLWASQLLGPRISRNLG